jgi:hypothetical protein
VVTFLEKFAPISMALIMAALTHTDLSGLTLVSQGKVRDIYSTSSADQLLFVATDRISAYDVILRNVRSRPSHPEHRQPTLHCRASRTRAAC